MRRAALLCLLLTQPAGAARAQPFARVTLVEGTASIEPAHTNLAAGASLSEGDRITVMSGSRLRLKLAAGHVIEVGPHSELLFKTNLEKHPLLRLPHGSLLVAGRSGTPLEIRSGQLRLQSEASALYLRQELDQPALLCACWGKVKAKWPLGKAEIDGKDHGSPVLIDRTKASVLPYKGKELFHSEKELDVLRSAL